MMNPQKYRDRCIVAAFKIEDARFKLVNDFIRGFPVGQRLKRDTKVPKYAIVLAHDRTTAHATLWYPQEQFELNQHMFTIALRYDPIETFPWVAPDPVTLEDIDQLTEDGGV